MADQQPTKVFRPLHWLLLGAAFVMLLIIWLWPRPAPEPEPDIIPITEEPTAAEPIEEAPTPDTAPEPEIVVTPETEPEPPEEPLPSLDESDPRVQADISQTTWSGLAELATNEYIIRKTVRAVVAASNGEWVNQHRPLQTPASTFKAESENGKLIISPSNYDRYTPYVNAITALDADSAVKLYSTYYPLLQEAYAELGLQDGSVDEAVDKALQQLTATPVYKNAELVHPSVMYKYKDKSIESLPEIQKLLIRMGPDNQRQLQEWLRGVSEKLKQESARAE